MRDLYVGAERLQPHTQHQVRLRRSDGTVVSEARLMTDGSGRLFPAPLWFNTGLDRCEAACGEPSRCTEPFESRLERLSRFRYRVELLGANGRLLGSRDLPVRPSGKPLVFASDAAGNPKDGFFHAEEPVYVSGYNFPPGSWLRVSVALDRERWRPDDAPMDVTGPLDRTGAPTAEPETLRLKAGQTSFTVLAWPGDRMLMGTYDVVAEIGHANPAGTPPESWEDSDVDNDGPAGFVIQGPAVPCTMPPPLFELCEHIEENVTVVSPMGALPTTTTGPNVTSKDAYLPTQDIWIAIDPQLRGVDLPTTPGNADVYVIADRGVAGWTNGLALGSAPDMTTDVSGAVETIVFQGTCSNVNYHLVSGPLPAGDYDVVIDLNRNGQYDIGADIVDGVSQVGFYVASTTIDIVDTVRKYWGTTDDYAPNVPDGFRCTDKRRLDHSCPITGVGGGRATINTRIEPAGTMVSFRLRVLRELTGGGVEEVAVLRNEMRAALGPTNDNSFAGTCPVAGCPTNIFTDDWDGQIVTGTFGLATGFDQTNLGTCAGETLNVSLPAVAAASVARPGRWVLEAAIDTNGDATFDTFDRETISVPQAVLLNLGVNRDCFNAGETDLLAELRAVGLEPLAAQVRTGIEQAMRRSYAANHPNPNRRVNVRFFQDPALTDCTMLPPGFSEPVVCMDLGGVAADDCNSGNGCESAGSFGQAPGSNWNDNPGTDIAGVALDASLLGVFPRNILRYTTGPAADSMALFKTVFRPLGVFGTDPGDLQMVTPCNPLVADSDCADGRCSVTAAEAVAFNPAPSPTMPAPYNFDPDTIYPDQIAMPTREQQIFIAYRAFTEFVAGTAAHELGHRLGVSSTNPTMRTQCGGHDANRTDALGMDAGPTGACRPPSDPALRICANSATDLMDSGSSRNFRERINDRVTGALGDQRFRLFDDLNYLRATVPCKRF